jgi:hypothetical protein
MPATPDLDDSDRAVLVALLTQTIAADPLPLSPRVKRLRGILDKLEPPATALSRSQRRSRLAYQHEPAMRRGSAGSCCTSRFK